MMWSGNDEAGNLSKPRQFGVGEASSDILGDDNNKPGHRYTSAERDTHRLIAFAVILILIVGGASLVSRLQGDSKPQPAAASCPSN